MTLSWSASTDAVGVTGYKIFKGGLPIGTSPSTSFAITGLTAATLYSFTVSAYDAAGNNSAVSSALPITTTAALDITAPTIPTALLASLLTQTSLTLSWTSSSDAVGVTGYKIFKGGSQIGISATNSFAVTGLTISTLYSFSVSAYDAAGNNSATSVAINVTTLGVQDTEAPTIPTINSAYGISQSTISISWIASTDNIGVTGYKVFVNGSQVGTSLVTNFSFTGLTPKTIYSLTVSAFDAAGNNSALSGVYKITTLPLKYKMAVNYDSNGKVSPGGYFTAYEGDSIKFTVTPNAGYQVNVVTIDGVNSGALTSFTISNIVAAHNIYVTFKVSANTIATYSGVSGGLASSSGSELNYGNSQSFNLTPSSGFQIQKTLVDGVNYNNFNNSTFSTVEFIVSKNSLSKMNRLYKNSESILALYRNENSPGNLNVKYEISIVGNDEIISGEVEWIKGGENKKDIESPFEEGALDENSLISVKLISVGEVGNDINADAIESDVAATSNNSSIENTSNIDGGSGSGGCRYVSSMSKKDQLGNIVLMFGFSLLLVFRRIRKNFAQKH